MRASLEFRPACERMAEKKDPFRSFMVPLARLVRDCPRAEGDWQQEHMPQILKKSDGKPPGLNESFARI